MSVFLKPLLMKAEKSLLLLNCFIRFPALGKIKVLQSKFLQKTIMSDFSIALNPSEQNISATFGLSDIKIFKNLINLLIA